MNNRFDIIVVGGGHAGCEAAMAAANMGSSVLLLTPDLSGLAKMSCNPAVGGIAKGQIVREVDALGGYSGLVTDAATLQFRMLNRSKGPAMWSPRAQCDKQKFSATWLNFLLSNCKLRIYADFAENFLFENQKIAGVRTITGAEFYSQAVILTAGTFLNGKMFVGQHSFEGGRIGEKAAYGISDELAAFGADCSGCMQIRDYEKAIQSRLNAPKIKGARAECACYLSCDIGAYNTCKHLCRYCYANAEPHIVLAQSRLHDSKSPFLIGTYRDDDIIHDVPQKSWIDGQMSLAI